MHELYFIDLCSYPMDKFNVEVEGIKYLVQTNVDGSFSLLSKGVEVLKLRLIVGVSLAFKWESDEGYKNHLIDKIGQAIEDHSL